MNDDLKLRIKAHYFNEYYQKIREEDNSFAGKIEKFKTRHEDTLLGLAGIGITALAGATYLIPSVILTPVVLIPAAVSSVVVMSGWAVVNANTCEKYTRDANDKMEQDLADGTLLVRYQKDFPYENPQLAAELKKQEEAATATAFAAAAKKEQETAKAAESIAETRLQNLKKNKPPKNILKKD